MSLFQTSRSPALDALLAELDALRSALGAQVAQPRPWVGAIRRQARAATARSSVAIEGFQVGEAEALAHVEGAPAGDSTDRQAFAAYVHAMHHVAVMSDDPCFTWNERVILDLHFDVCAWDRDARPGRLRTGPIGVTAPGGGLAYRGPDADQVPALLRAFAGSLQDEPAEHVVVRAALAHLDLVSIHPFHDGNGRISRIVQSLVLAREGLLAPELGSIEEHLASDTAGYHRVLQEVQGGGFDPARDATPWVMFCVRAHIAQASRRLDQVSQAAARWDALERLVQARGWPDRYVTALERALFGAVDRAAYAGEVQVSPSVASTDLTLLVAAGLLERQGRGRVTRYVASAALRSQV